MAPHPRAQLVLPLVLLLLASVSPPGADAWGKEGHIMVCQIAEKYLSEKAAAAVQDLLPPSAGGELSEVCPWADQARWHYHWSSPLHYANTPEVCGFKYSRTQPMMELSEVCPWADQARWHYHWSSPLHYANTPEVCGFKYSRDCHNSRGQQGMCVVGAINNYTDQLYSYGHSKSSYNLTESLMFLAHFVGDVHQPLHVGYEEDEGGNTINVHWYRRKANLHHVWDVSIIDTAIKDFYNKSMDNMVETLEMNLTDGWSDDITHWENCENKRATCANDYAIESIHLSCNYAYKDVEEGITLGDDYFFSRYPVVQKRLAQAGIRLALILNRIFDGDETDVKPVQVQ